MANSNFVVHNGLTVGPLTIDAATGSINTSGNISFGGAVGVDTISKGDSSIAITDFGTNSTVLITIDNTARANITSSGLAVTGTLNTSGNILGAAGSFSTLNTTGLATTAGLNSSANILATGGIFSSLTVNGNESVTGYLNVTGNVLGAAGTFSSVNTTGNVLGAVGTFSTINIGSGTAATVADATALAIALGG